MDSVSIEQSWSKALFGNKHMLRVSSSIAQGGVEFTAPELGQVTGLGPSSVHRLLGVLCSVGLLMRLPRDPGERMQRYRRIRQPFWKAMSQMREAANSPGVWEGDTG